MSEHRAYIGIGTNLGDRVANLERAMEAVATFGTLLAKSSLYRTAPWGNLAQPWFLNAVVLLKTELAPRELLDSSARRRATFGSHGARALGTA